MAPANAGALRAARGELCDQLACLGGGRLAFRVEEVEARRCTRRLALETEPGLVHVRDHTCRECPRRHLAFALGLAVKTLLHDEQTGRIEPVAMGATSDLLDTEIVQRLDVSATATLGVTRSVRRTAGTCGASGTGSLLCGSGRRWWKATLTRVTPRSALALPPRPEVGCHPGPWLEPLAPRDPLGVAEHQRAAGALEELGEVAGARRPRDRGLLVDARPA